MIPDNTTIILQTQVGSGLHGTAVDGQDDRDEMGIGIPPTEYVIGIDRWEQHIQRDQPDGVRSQPGDLDLTIYSLQKWAFLAAKGNPSILQLLYVPEDACIVLTDAGWTLIQHRDMFITKQAGKAFLGYCKAQREKLVGQRGQKGVKRPELEEMYGFDTKFAMHAYRLCVQGIELMTEGNISLPMKSWSGSIARGIRTGEYTYEQTLHIIEAAEISLYEAYHKADIPLQVDRRKVSELISSLHLVCWELADISRQRKEQYGSVK